MCTKVNVCMSCSCGYHDYLAFPKEWVNCDTVVTCPDCGGRLDVDMVEESDMLDYIDPLRTTNEEDEAEEVTGCASCGVPHIGPSDTFCNDCLDDSHCVAKCGICEVADATIHVWGSHMNVCHHCHLVHIDKVEDPDMPF